MDDVIIKLQEAIAHQGEDLLHVSKELYAQQKEIAQLHEIVEKLKLKLDSMQDEGADSFTATVDTKPPHY